MQILGTSASLKSWPRATPQTVHMRQPAIASISGNAARLSANERIKNRVREIQSIGFERAAVTVQSLIDEAERVRIKAMKSPNGAAAAVSAITAKAKLAGLWREKIDQHTTGTVSTVWSVGWEDEDHGGQSDE